MSNYRLLNTCLLVSLVCHFFILVYLVNSPISSEKQSILTPVELFTIKKIVPSFPANVMASFALSNSRMSDSVPSNSIIKKSRSFSLTNQIIDNHARGGEGTATKDFILPLRSSFEQANERVDLTLTVSAASYAKAVPDFDEQGLDYINRGLFVKEESLNKKTPAGMSATARKEKKGYIDRYRMVLMEKVRRVVSYPGWARKRGVMGQVTLQVLIKRDGEISNVEVYKSSGNSRLDKETVSSVSAINTFPAFPQEFLVSEAKILIPVDYNLN